MAEPAVQNFIALGLDYLGLSLREPTFSRTTNTSSMEGRFPGSDCKHFSMSSTVAQAPLGE